MNIEINIEDYFSKDEIKGIIADQVRVEVGRLFRDEQTTTRMLSNLSFEIVFNEIDKIVPDSRKLIFDKVAEILGKEELYGVFRNRDYGKPSLAYTMIEDAVKANADLIKEKTRDAIVNKDISDDVWKLVEKLSEDFMGNIYEIVKIARAGKKENP